LYAIYFKWFVTLFVYKQIDHWVRVTLWGVAKLLEECIVVGVS
jgi:hypothetical protein